MQTNTSRPARRPCSTTTATGSVPASINRFAFSRMRQSPALWKEGFSAPQMEPTSVACEYQSESLWDGVPR